MLRYRRSNEIFVAHADVVDNHTNRFYVVTRHISLRRRRYAGLVSSAISCRPKICHRRHYATTTLVFGATRLRAVESAAINKHVGIKQTGVLPVGIR